MQIIPKVKRKMEEQARFERTWENMEQAYKGFDSLARAGITAAEAFANLGRAFGKVLD